MTDIYAIPAMDSTGYLNPIGPPQDPEKAVEGTILGEGQNALIQALLKEATTEKYEGGGILGGLVNLIGGIFGDPDAGSQVFGRKKDVTKQQALLLQVLMGQISDKQAMKRLEAEHDARISAIREEGRIRERLDRWQHKEALERDEQKAKLDRQQKARDQAFVARQAEKDRAAGFIETMYKEREATRRTREETRGRIAAGSNKGLTKELELRRRSTLALSEAVRQAKEIGLGKGPTGEAIGSEHIEGTYAYHQAILQGNEELRDHIVKKWGNQLAEVYANNPDLEPAVAVDRYIRQYMTLMDSVSKVGEESEDAITKEATGAIIGDDVSAVRKEMLLDLEMVAKQAQDNARTANGIRVAFVAGLKKELEGKTEPVSVSGLLPAGSTGSSGLLGRLGAGIGEAGDIFNEWATGRPTPGRMGKRGSLKLIDMLSKLDRALQQPVTDSSDLVAKLRTAIGPWLDDPDFKAAVERLMPNLDVSIAQQLNYAMGNYTIPAHEPSK